MEPRGLPTLLKLSEAFRRENMVRASGKLGGVAGVFAGVHIYWERVGVGGEERRVTKQYGKCSVQKTLGLYSKLLQAMFMPCVRLPSNWSPQNLMVNRT